MKNSNQCGETGHQWNTK